MSLRNTMTVLAHKARINRKFVTFLLFGIFVCVLLLLILSPEESMTRKGDSKDCYRRTISESVRNDDEYAISYLVDVMEADKKPTPGKSIIFHQTSCSKSGLVDLNTRQTCAIESAAKLNPNRDIFVLFASPVGFRKSFTSLPTNIQILQTYSNVHLRNNDLWKYAAGTPLEKWLTTDTLFQSKYLFEHMSDVLRYLSLYKFGGIFMDLDVVVQKNFDDLGENYAGDDSVDAIGCGVIHLGIDPLGKMVAEHCMSFMEKNFNGKTFIDNGPLVITRTLEKICQTTDRRLMTRERCQGFRVYPDTTFYAISWEDWRMFFDPKMTNQTLALVENSTVAHVWNDVSKEMSVKTGEKTAYEVVAKKYCPNVYLSRVNYEYF